MSTRLNPRTIVVVVVVGLAALAGAGWWIAHRAPPVRYVTTPAARGDVVTTITASGTVNPVFTIQVGSYVSGPIQSLSCDYNTQVRKGQLCAKIDPATYQQVVDEDRADLATSRAQLVKDQANLVYAKLAHERADLLFRQDSGSRDAADQSLNAYNQARAQVALDAATIDQKAALLKAAEVNLNYTNIVSPVDGTVVSRNVTMGQTVAASFQTPTLFLIATDLTKMQVDTNVSESDIAGAVEGADASFTVDAFPDVVFHGVVTQVRQAPVSVQNVITYDAVVTVANPKLLLKPGMTATTSLVRGAARDVLRVPSQALRFAPVGVAAAHPAGKGAGRTVWVQRDGKAVAVPVTVGLDDGAFAEIKAGELKAGDLVITAEAPAGGAGRRRGAPTTALRL